MKRIIAFLIFAAVLLNLNAQVSTVDEGFETWPPADWSLYTLGAGNGWITDWQAIYHSGSNSAYAGINNSICDSWMVTPQINITSNDYELKYWEINDDVQYYDYTEVLISTGSGNPTDGDFVNIYSAPDVPETWTQRTIDLSAYVGQNIYFAFRYEGTWHNWFIDDVVVAPPSFIDGVLSEIINPVGVSPGPSTENVTVTLENKGTNTITTVDISWEVNSAVQTPYNNTTLNLLPGASIDLTLGAYNFNTPGAYDITATLLLSGDIDAGNDTVIGTYSIATAKDAALLGIDPEAMFPLTGLQDVSVILENQGVNTIENLEVDWTVDGVTQTTYVNNGLNITPGEVAEITIGQFDFSTGVYEITAALNALGDINPDNDSYHSYTAIDTLWESFEGRVFPPENWTSVFSVKDGLAFDIPAHADYYYAAFTDNNFFGAVSDTLFTPLLDVNVGDQFRMNVKSSGFLPSNMALVWKNGMTGEIQLIQNVITSADEVWEELTIDISAAAGTNYIGIVSAEAGGPGAVKYDLITSDAKLHVPDNDLAVANGDIYFLAKADVSEGFDCLVKNRGSSQVQGTDYTLRLMEEPGILLASISGVTLDSYEEATITVNYTFTSINSHRLYFEIDYAADDLPSNNSFRSSDVHVVPNTVIINDIGQPDYQSLNYPFDGQGSTNTLGEDDISQSLYESNQISTSGDIYGFIYKYDNIIAGNEVKLLPLKVWVAQTDITDLSGGWYPYSDLNLVYDDTLEILQGTSREIYIPFNSPETYTELNNIVIQDYQYDPAWPPAGLRIYGASMPAGTTRTIAALEVFNLDPTAPEPFYNEFQDVPYTRFVVDPIAEYCDVSGTVFGTGGLALADVTVHVEGTAITAQTDMNGDYVLPGLPYGTYDLTAGILGYNDSTIAVTLNTEMFTQDFYLIEREQVDVTGMVVGSNAITIPLENVQVFAVGYSSDNTNTDMNGDFILSNIFGVSEYDVTFSLYGYYDKTITVSVTDANIDMGTVVLEQEFISPFDVNVMSGSSTLVHWKDPLKSAKVKLQNDFNVNSYSYTNEPNENVWLGNVFSITDTTTITSVEFVTDIYVNAIDFVTIDVFDVNEELVASSEPFLIHPDSVHIIDIPNIVVYDDVYVMIHWQDNPISTNSLTVDFSDPLIPNTAIIKYPSEPIQLLTDFFNNGAPNMSFLIRTNTLDVGNNVTNNEDLTYNVYRGLPNEFPDITNWEMINTTPVTAESILDLDAQSGTYRYAVESIYTGGVSEVTFSNVIDVIVGTLEQLPEGMEVRIYPVPAKDFITIEIVGEVKHNVSIQVFDATGRLIDYVDPFIGTSSMIRRNVSDFSNGWYTIHLNINGGIFSSKILIAH